MDGPFIIELTVPIEIEGGYLTQLAFDELEPAALKELDSLCNNLNRPQTNFQKIRPLIFLISRMVDEPEQIVRKICSEDLDRIEVFLKNGWISLRSRSVRRLLTP